jgi:alpha-aminoadipate/glutamate carrier protein LysW
MITCPMCDADIDVEEEDLDEGDELTCDECGATISVTSTGPLELEANDEEDDDEDEEDSDFGDDEEEEEEEEDWR